MERGKVTTLSCEATFNRKKIQEIDICIKYNQVLLNIVTIGILYIFKNTVRKKF